jgi:hypothetical protein
MVTTSFGPYVVFPYSFEWERRNQERKSNIHMVFYITTCPPKLLLN